jgi:thymidylate synthase
MSLHDLDHAHAMLVNDVLDGGQHRVGRNGGFTSKFGLTLRADLQSCFPIITTRKIYWRGIFGELAAFLEGATSLKRFRELGCNYWEHNARQWPQFDGDNLGPLYGAQWRNFGGVDQLAGLVHSLNVNAASRRHVMTTWNPPQLDTMCLPPCHLLTQFHVAGGLLHQTVYMRSVDLCLGLPADLVLYGLLQHLVATQTIHLRPGELVFMLGDAHVYDNHRKTWEQQNSRRVLSTTEKAKPRIIIDDDASLFGFHPGMAKVVDYHPSEALGYALN